MFLHYLEDYEAREIRRALMDLFNVLDTPEQERDKYLAKDNPKLARFPYVNGGLFRDLEVEIPPFTDAIRTLLLQRASADFDWSQISPTIFGAVFESTLNPETRRSGGMHYTSVENIHRVIDPLFLDSLRHDLATTLRITVTRTRRQALHDLQKRLAALRFLDPACGSGNFLTETYLSLRRLENDIIHELYPERQIGFDNSGSVIRVSIGQLYGIEINDFAVAVAKTALWIAESQMMRETEQIVSQTFDALPLKTSAHIVEGNALRIDWRTLEGATDVLAGGIFKMEDSVGKTYHYDYIIGNPPFIGKKEQTKEQKAELTSVFGKGVRGVGNLDYVTGWYVKAMENMRGSDTRAAFVSTNSITQGEQVPVFWKFILGQGLHVDYAYRTFPWGSESKQKAHVHCVIIGFSAFKSNAKKYIFEGDKRLEANNINPYLLDAPNVFIESRTTALCKSPQIFYGSMPIDHGHLILSRDDVDSLLKENPENIKFIRRYVGGDELLKSKERWCLWLVDVSPKELKRSNFIKERLRLTAEYRRGSNRPQTLALANTPMLFGEIRQPITTMLVIPNVSSEHRRYIPMSYVTPETIVNGSALIIPKAGLYHFSILSSKVHNAWMRVVAGRMEMRYQYSNSIVYNNFPWPSPTLEQRKIIETKAQAILDARSHYPDNSLEELYGQNTMPLELLKAHEANDRAVLNLYGLPNDASETDIVSHLMDSYRDLTN